MIDDLFGFELCFPGGISGSTEVLCPHCGVELTVPVADPLGQDSFRCAECEGEFDVDWAEETVTPKITINLDFNIELKETE